MALSNCAKCDQLFQNVMHRKLCPACYGQSIFGQKPVEAAPEVRAPEAILATRRVGAEHALRCEIRADEARAHRGTVRWGRAKFW